MFYSQPEAITWYSDIFIAPFSERTQELSGTAHRLVYYGMPDWQPWTRSASLLAPSYMETLNQTSWHSCYLNQPRTLSLSLSDCGVSFLELV